MQAARDRGWTLYACNDAFRLAPDAALLFGCNYQWWAARWPDVAALPAEKWTTNRRAADQFGIQWIQERDARGLSTRPDVLHHGHSSGYQLVGMAQRARARRIVLLGYDMRFAPDYDGYTKRAGSGPRHFFGEYEHPDLQHWPKLQVREGVHVELVDLYGSIAKQGLVEIINCTPGSAVRCFPCMDVADVD